MATAAALDEARGDPALRPALEAVFDAQRGLLEAQRHHLHVQLRQLKLRIAGDRIRLALQALTLAAILGLVVMIGAIVRDAVNDNGLVIDRFTAPPQLVAQGLDGEALADQMLGRIAAIRRLANANSITVSDDVRGRGADSLKVEIPETGLSLDQVARFLHESLGHAQRLNGAVSEDAHGHAVIDIGLSGADPIRVEGDAADLDRLMQQAAERAFAAFDTVNYVLYLRASGRHDEAMAAAERNFKLARTPLDIYDGLSLWANTDGDRRRALVRALLATETYPKGWAGWSEAAQASRQLGHDEAALAYLRRELATRREDQWRNHRAAFPFILLLARTGVARALGDDRQLGIEAVRRLDYDRRTVSDRYLALVEARAGEHDCAAAGRDLAYARATGPLSPTEELDAGWKLAVCRDDRASALAAAQSLAAAYAARAAAAQGDEVGYYATPLATLYQPRLALALSRAGRQAEAASLIAASPPDCYLCASIRGQIAAAGGDAAGADRWSAEAVRQAPSLPVAWLQWARIRLARGDAIGAMAELKIANARAPNFADPLELWGEALARQGDADGAVGRYARANALAPRWGRLHLAWGEALQRLGRDDAARAQFALARQLDLSAADRAELERWGG
jgi:hypothetical protein